MTDLAHNDGDKVRRAVEDSGNFKGCCMNNNNILLCYYDNDDGRTCR